VDRLLAAKKIQTEASALGFDWPDISGAMEKISEEAQEIQDALNDDNIEHAKKELGDLLFAVVNVSRFLDADPARELLDASKRFTQRFKFVQQKLREAHKAIGESSMEELDRLWESAKREEGNGKKKWLDMG